MTERIAVISGKGGVGKTTLSANLGSIMAHVFDRSVTVIDTDVTSSHLGVHMGFQYNPATLASILKGEHSVEEGLYEHDTGVKIVPGALNYDDVKDVDVYELVDVVDEIAEQTDVVILDCSPGLDRETSAALRSADHAMYVARPSFTSVIDVIRAQSLVDDIDRDHIGVVLNMVRGKKHEIDPEEIESFTDLDVIASIPFDDTLEQAAAQGTPITVYDRHAKASRAMEDLAIHLLDEDPAKKPSSLMRNLREAIPKL